MLRSFCCAALGALLALPALAQEETSKEERKDYACGDLKLAVWTVQDYEEQHVVVWFLDKNDDQVRPNITAPGKFVSLCSQGAFLLLDNTGAHYQTGPSFMMSAQGDVLGSMNVGYEVSYAVTRDGKLIWVQSYEERAKQLRTRLQVMDASGRIVHNQTYSAAIDVSISYERKWYPISVLKPDTPY
ncbi:MAG: hypothetical protein ABMA14_06820 [Hyphomonadaceae bacterium]